MSKFDLHETVQCYRQSIEAIEADPISAEQVLKVLIARELVDVALNQQQGQHPFVVRVKEFLLRQPCHDPQQQYINAIRSEIKELDRRLRKRSDQIPRALKVSYWREISKSPEKNWLRLLEEPLPLADNLDWLWRLLSLGFFGVAIVILVDIIRILAGDGMDSLTLLGIVIPVILTFLSGGGTLTGFGQEITRSFFDFLNIQQKWWDEFRCLFALSALILLLVFRYDILPDIANSRITNPERYNQSLVTQETWYKTAIALAPQNFPAYWGLATLYQEELLDFDGALQAYQDAAEVAEDKSDRVRAKTAAIHVLIDQGRLEQADQQLRKVIGDSKNQVENPNVQIYYETIKRLGQAYLEAGQTNSDDKDKSLAAAIRWFEERLDRICLSDSKDYYYRFQFRIPQCYEMRTYLGLTHLERGNIGEAAGQFEAASTLYDKTQEHERPAPAQCLLTQALEKQNENNRDMVVKAEKIMNAARGCLSAKLEHSKVDRKLQDDVQGLKAQAGTISSKYSSGEKR